jgi:hypothetical protein
MNNLVATNIVGTRFVSIDKYNHKPAGVFVGAGPAFEPSSPVDRLSLTDVAPVVMSLAGCPVPARMTGAVPPNLLSAPVDVEAYDTPEYGSGDSTQGDDRVEARLEDLGYL